MTFKYRYRKQIIIISIIVVIIGSLIFLGYYYFNDKEDSKKKTNLLESTKKEDKEKDSKKEEITEIMIDIKGEVINQGIYKLKSGSRVIDAINMAGGLTNNANTSVLNLSKKLIDEMVIIVYSNYEVENFEKTKEEETKVLESCKTGYDNIENDACIEPNTTIEQTTSKISINNASLEELMTLSGIGEAKAKSIIEYREQNGGFNSIEDIKNVTGIGDALFDQIKENITL